MIINPAKAPLPAALPPAVVAGGNAPTNGPATDDMFAALVARIAGGDGTAVAGKTQTSNSGRTSRTPGSANGVDDPAADAASSAADPNDPAAIAIAFPAWVWAVNQPIVLPTSLALPSIGSATTSTGKPGDQSQSTSSTDDTAAAGLAVGALPPITLTSLVSVAPPLTESATAFTTPSSDTPVVPAAPTALADPSKTLSAMAASSQPVVLAQPGQFDSAVGAASASTDKTPADSLKSLAGPTTNSAVGSATASGAALNKSPVDSTPDNLTPAPVAGSTSSPTPAGRAGRTSAGVQTATGSGAATVGAQGDRASLRHVGQSSDGAAAAGAKSPDVAAASDPQVGTGRPVERPALDGTIRTKDLAGPAADGKAALPLALSADRLANGRGADQPGQDSARSFSEAREQVRAEAAQAPAAQAIDAAVAAVAAHSEHANPLATGQPVEIGHVTSTSQALGSAIPVASELVDRGASLDDAGLHRQIVQAIQLQSRDGVGDARITLRPEYLGEVTIALRVENGGVTAHVSAATEEIRNWLGANESLLRQGLSEQGLTLDRLIVSEEPAAPGKEGQARREQQPPPDDQQRPRPERETGTFEITV